MSIEGWKTEELVEWNAGVLPVFVVGEALYGVCDRVPGVSHCATLFIHLYGVPLIPRRSFLICYDPNAPCVVAIGMNIKSVFMTYARTVLFTALLVAGYYIVTGAPSAIQGEIRFMAIGVCVFAVAACSFKVAIRWEKASPTKAERLCAHLSDWLQTSIKVPDAAELKACSVCGRESANTIVVCPFCGMGIDELET